MENKVTFPKLRGCIASKGLTQKGLAKLMKERGVDITPSGLSNKINGIRDFKRVEMQVISEILEENPVELFFKLEYTKCVLKKADIQIA